MGTISLVIPQIGQPDTTEDVKVQNAFTTIQTVINGNLDRTNLTSTATSLTPSLPGGSTTASANQMVVAAPGATITLPAPVAGMVVGVVANSSVTAASPVTVARGGASVIFGVGLSSATSFLLGTASASVILESYDGTNWIVTSGQQDTGWVPLTLATNIVAAAGAYTPSVRLRGDMLKLSGSVQNNTGGNTSASFATLPVGMRPSLSIPTGVLVWVGTQSATFQITSSGTMFIQTFVSTSIVALDMLGEFRIS